MALRKSSKVNWRITPVGRKKIDIALLCQLLKDETSVLRSAVHSEVKGKVNPRN